jgi:hypothetical protein
MTESIYLSRFVPKTIRVYLVDNPDIQVLVKTTETGVRAKLKGIRRDISYQKFPRWAPFDKQKWDWEFVE